jgi:AcrR family transcriptional regulator
VAGAGGNQVIVTAEEKILRSAPQHSLLRAAVFWIVTQTGIVQGADPHLYDTLAYRNRAMHLWDMPRASTPRPGTERALGRPRDERAHAAILDAAIDLTREVGYDALAIDAIAARAGVGKTTIYRRWAGKEELMADAVERIVRMLPTPDTGSLERDLLVLMRSTMAMYRDPATPPLLSGLIAAMVRSPIIARKVRAGFIGVRREAMRNVLRRAVARGELARSIDEDLILDMLAGPMLWRCLMNGRPIDDDFVRRIVRGVLRAFAPREAKPT